MANSITLDSRGYVHVAPIKAGKEVRPFLWEDEPAWYDPKIRLVNFVVLPANGVGPPPGPGPQPPTVSSVLATFGQPARAYFLANYTVLVWGTDLLTDMNWQGLGSAAGPSRQTNGGPEPVSSKR
jgi:hypothetical protein